MSYNNTQQYFLGDLYDISSGLSKSKDQFGSGYPFLSFKTVFNHTIIPTDLKDLAQTTLSEQNKYSILYGDVFLTRTSETANELGMSSVALKNYPQATFNGFTKRLRPKKGVMEIIDPKFIAYYLRTKDFRNQIDSISVLTTRASLNQGMIEKLTITVPNIKTQKKIAAILSALDEKIAINRAINENLERQAQALFKSWFVDFEPVSNYGFIESAIGAIPCGWRIYTLSEFLPVITGKKNANVSSDKGLYPFFSCSQDFSWTNEFSFDGHAILVAGNGDFSVKWYNGKFEAYQRTYVLIPSVERYTDWLYYAVKYNLESITSAARGSVIKFITKGNLENFAFAAPENLEKCEIIDTFSSINRIIDALTQENYRLAEIRDSLLPKLMAGEIDVSAVQL